MSDKQPDDKGQQAERGEIEVKALGQALQATIVAGWLQLEAVSNGRGQWRLVIRQQQPR
ncbi:hypothetical protein D3C81_761400 [compost metagenome]